MVTGFKNFLDKLVKDLGILPKKKQAKEKVTDHLTVIDSSSVAPARKKEEKPSEPKKQAVPVPEVPPETKHPPFQEIPVETPETIRATEVKKIIPEIKKSTTPITPCLFLTISLM